MMSNYYESNAERYAAETFFADMRTVSKISATVKKRSKDSGCGKWQRT